MNRLKKNNQSDCYAVESVSEGHPDKLCDLIAQKILDYCLLHDKQARVACEVFASNNHLIIGGEIKATFLTQSPTSKTNFIAAVKRLALEVIKQDVGYTTQSWSNLDQLKLEVMFHTQSAEIQNQVERNTHLRLGDNTVVFGYACSGKDSLNYFPLPHIMANLIMQKLNQVRKTTANQKWQFAPDGKIIVVGSGSVIKQIFLCQQFLYPSAKFTAFEEQNQRDLFNQLIKPLLDKYNFKLATDFQWHVTPFHIGGPVADTGLTGRKIMVDAYGTFVRHGGGSYIGKDYSKGDCSLALYARFIAKHLVVAKFMPKIEIQINAVIGNQKILNIFANVPLILKARFNQILREVFNWNFQEVIDRLKLRQPHYFPYASYGFFGRSDPEPSWEQIDSTLIIKIQKIIHHN